MKFPSIIHIKASGLRPKVATTKEGIRLIDEELPAELRALRRWTFARALVLAAERSGKKRDLLTAFRQIKQALMEEGWLVEQAKLRPQRGSRLPPADPRSSSRRA